MLTYAVVIPAHNEARFLPAMLESLAAQTHLPIQAIVVDDSSTDDTFAIASAYGEKYPWLSCVQNQSEAKNLPGSKVIRAFERGFRELTAPWDIIVKLDADLILPSHYFERIVNHFEIDGKAGIVGGFASIEKNGGWVIEKLTDNDHVRGAFKAYRKSCFQAIGGLRAAMGWDTADELLARYHGFTVVTIPELIVKHLKPTGAVYDKAARYKQGEAFYALGYGFTLTAIASAKLAMMKGRPALFSDYILGYLKASKNRMPKLVNADEERFIRRYRWQKIRAKLSNSSI